MESEIGAEREGSVYRRAPVQTVNSPSVAWGNPTAEENSVLEADYILPFQKKWSGMEQYDDQETVAPLNVEVEYPVRSHSFLLFTREI